jgi:hypothetical protein
MRPLASTGRVAGKGQLSLGWIEAFHDGWCTAVDDQFGESAVAASDVDPALIHGRGKPIEKLLAGKLAPHPHHALVSGAVVKADPRLCHARIIPSSRRRQHPRT